MLGRPVARDWPAREIDFKFSARANLQTGRSARERRRIYSGVASEIATRGIGTAAVTNGGALNHNSRSGDRLFKPPCHRARPASRAEDSNKKVDMKRLIYAAAAVALLAAPDAAFAQYYDYATANQYTYPAPDPAGSAAWGYTYYYGSSSYSTPEASASSHPAFYGGSGQFAYHPGLGWGY
jgi:hypothetical protein